jgi:hypothetical protein
LNEKNSFPLKTSGSERQIINIYLMIAKSALMFFKGKKRGCPSKGSAPAQIKQV